MEASAQTKHVYRFGLFRLDPASGTLLRQGVAIKLQDQSFRVLFLLLQRPGEIVSREALRQAIWPGGTYVEFDTNLNAILKRLRSALGDDADNPTFIETVPKRGYRFIAPLQCEPACGPALDTLEPTALGADAGKPESDYAVATDVLATDGNGIPSREKATWVKFLALGLAVMAAAAMVVVLAHMYRAKQILQTHAVVKAMELAPRPSVAIMKFENASGQPERNWLSTAIPEMLSTELAADGKLRVIPGEDVARMTREFQLPSAGTLAADTAVRAGRNLKANLLVVGSYVVVGATKNPPMRIDLRIQDAATGEVVAELEESGKEKGLFDLISEAGAHVRERMGLPNISAEEQAGFRAAVPSNPDAARLYAKGLALLRNYDAAGARDLFEQAIAAEPNFPLSHAALASAWSTLGYGQKARAEAKNALDLSGGLPRADRLLIEGRYHVIWAQRAEAISAYRALFALLPDSVDDGLLLTHAEISGGHPNEALDTVKALRALPPPLAEDPRIDMAEAHIFNAIGDLRRQAQALERARDKAKAQGSPLLAARAEFEEVWPLEAGGQPQEAMKLCQDTLPVFAEAGDRGDVAAGARFMGDIQLNQGRLQDALDDYRRGLQISREMGNVVDVANILNEMAIVYELQGSLKQAERMYRRSYELFVEVADRGTAAGVNGNVGETLLEQGELEQAAKVFEQGLDLGREVGAKDAEGGAYSDLALLALTRGQLDVARQFGEQSVAIKHSLDRGYDLVAALGLLGDIYRMQGDVAGSRKNDAEALSIGEKIGAKVLVGEVRLTLAELDLDDGHAAQAEPAVRQSLLSFTDQGVLDDEVRALAVLARCLLMQNRAKDAENVLDRGRELAARSQNPSSRLLFAIADARVRAARAGPTKSPNAARAELLKSIDTAHHLGLVTLEYRARLALAEIQMETNPVAGKRYAASLADDARAHGFGLVANRAAALQ